MIPSPVALPLLLFGLSFQPCAPESSRERHLRAAAPCGDGSDACAVDGSRWSNDTAADFAKHLPGDLRELRLGLRESTLDDACLGALAGRLPEHLQHIQLDLHNTGVGNRGLVRLAAALPADLKHLQLDLSKTKVTDRGLKRLAAALPAGLKHLQLVLYDTKVSDRGLERLAAALPAGLEHLQLDLRYTNVGDGGLERLAAALPAGLQHLQLNLSGTSVGDHGLERLAQALPQAHVKVLVLDLDRSSKASLHSIEALLQQVPSGLEKLYLDGQSCDTGQVSDKSSSSIRPLLWDAIKQNHRYCSGLFAIAARNPNLKEQTTGMTALLLAAKEGRINIIRDLVSLGANTFDRDNLGQSARDIAGASQSPGLLYAIPGPTFPRVLGHLAHTLKFWIVSAACLLVAGVASAPWEYGVTHAGGVEGGLPGGAVSLAAKAMHGKAMAMYARATRILEVVTNLVGITAVLQRLTPAVGLPICCLLYGVPRLLLPRRDMLEVPLGVELAVSRASLLDVAGSRRGTVRRSAFGIVRLGLLFFLASLPQVPPSALNGTGGAALHRVSSNERRGVCLDGVAPALRLMGWQPWSFTASRAKGTLRPNGCIIHDGDDFPSSITSSMLTSSISEVNSTGVVFTIGGRILHQEEADGVPPFGDWQALSTKTVVICPGSSVCLATPRVYQLWSLLKTACKATVLLWAFAAAGFLVLGACRSHQPQQRRVEILALARRIAAAGTAEEVGKLTGAAGPVQPVRALVLVPPGGIYLTLFLVFLDIFLDAYTIYTMILNEDVYFAGVLLATTLFSTIREVRGGLLSSFRGWVAETVRTGILADGLQRLLDNERGSEALISLLVSSYALPFTIQSPLDALLCPLSVLSSAIGLGTFLHEYLDLSPVEPEDEEESEGTKDSETGEQSSDSSCTSSGSE